MKRLTSVVLLSAAIALAGCGQSKEEKATSQVCDARADISKQVDDLKGLTLTTASIAGVKQNLSAIRTNLGKIKDAQSDLKDQRREQVKAANEAFGAQVTATAQNVVKSRSLSGASTQLKASFTALGDSYRSTLGRIDCS